jgi:hypothetical protein
MQVVDLLPKKTTNRRTRNVGRPRPTKHAPAAWLLRVRVPSSAMISRLRSASCERRSVSSVVAPHRCVSSKTNSIDAAEIRSCRICKPAAVPKHNSSFANYARWVQRQALDTSTRRGVRAPKSSDDRAHLHLTT